ncbi:MAG TPA: NAD(P)H-binding protein [Gemmatimonadaceae bacterium]
MKVLLFGATGMIGQAVLRECLRDPDVLRVVAVGRRPTDISDPKLADIVESDIANLAPHESELRDVDACLFCLGVTSVGLSEAEYSRLTYDLTLAAARALARINVHMTFIYVSGAGTDSTELGRVMWARVKGRTENALLALGFHAAYMFRPGAVIPLHGIRSRTGWYNAVYALIRPIAAPLVRLSPAHVTTSDRLARAMLVVAHDGYLSPIVESSDINRIGAR